MNSHIKQIYILHLKDKAPISELKAYIAAYGVHDEIEWDYDEGYALKYEHDYRYKSIQHFIDNYIKK